MTVRTTTVAALVTASFWLAGGCSTTSTTDGGTATFNKATGNMSTTVEAPLDRAFEASLAALEDLEFRTLGQSKDALNGVINAETATGDDIKVSLQKRTDAVTDVTIGMGPLGKESTARILLENIQNQLK